MVLSKPLYGAETQSDARIGAGILCHSDPNRATRSHSSKEDYKLKSKTRLGERIGFRHQGYTIVSKNVRTIATF